jgi:multidrug efflux system outer membrane protein
MAKRSRRAGVVCTAALSVGICGCAPVGPRFVRPAVPTPAQYRFVTDAAQGESMADAPWWRVFEDPELQGLVREAIGSNLDVRAAVARVEQARAQAGIARSFLYPQVDGTASYTLQQNSGTADGDMQQGGIFGLQLSWELDLFGKIRRQREAAVAEMLASEQGRRGVLVTLVGDVATTYFLLRQLDLELQIARRTLQVNDRTVVYFQDRLDGGVSNRLEVDRIKSNRSQTAAAIPDFERQLAVAEHAMSLLLGRTPGPIARATAPPAMGLGSPPSIPPGLPASLLERRPDVVQAEQLLVAANANVGVAKALFFPAIDLTGFLGGVSGDLTTLLGNGGAVWSLGSGLLQPIFNAGRLKHNLASARAAVDEAVALYRKAALNGYREVANALISIQKLGEIRVERQAAVDVLRDAGDLARSRYESGLATYLEILDADQQLFQQELLLAQAQGAELQARTDLYRALGGGWQP